MGIGRLKLRMTLRQRKALTGVAFSSPFIVGFVCFFLYPLIQSFAFSLSEIKLTQTGYETRFIGLQSYRHALFVDARFVRTLVSAFGSMFATVPAILIFSFFAASLLNQQFRGRTLARAIFFLPVILSSATVIELARGDYMHGAMGANSVLSSQVIQSFLMQLKLPASFTEYIISAVVSIPEVINSSGIPILIFLAGLQSIPSSLFEVAQIEGATAWECFWRITFPLLSPLVLTNVVYIIVDSFTNASSPVLRLIENTAWAGAGYAISVAMSWIYFVCIGAVLAIVFVLISRRVFYMR